MNLGKLIVDVGTLVARQCDKFVAKTCPEYPKDKLEKIIRYFTSMIHIL